MERLRIREADLVEKFVQGSGPGGQKINKTSSSVYLKHLPSRIEIQCQETRSRDRNREIARERLCDRIEQKQKEAFLQKAKERSLKRFRNKKPSAATKARVRENKTRRSDKKKTRGKVGPRD